MEKSSSCQDHGELTGVVGVVEPGLVVDVPCVIPPGETHHAISGLTPHSERHKPAEVLPFSHRLDRMNYFTLFADNLVLRFVNSIFLNGH